MEISEIVEILDTALDREASHLKQTDYNDYITIFLAGNDGSVDFLVNDETEITGITRCCLNHHDNHCYIYIVRNNFNNVCKFDIAEINSLVIS